MSDNRDSEITTANSEPEVGHGAPPGDETAQVLSQFLMQMESRSYR